MRNQDRFRGCLIAGAAGDALGYTVEFLREGQIFRRFGPEGIRAYEPVNGNARISDDTQMTLFTAVGLLRADALGNRPDADVSVTDCIAKSYADWLRTQENRYSPAMRPHTAWLGNVPELYAARAPGNTCMTALHRKEYGTLEKRINTSKGCGGVMRVAPVGLYYNDTGKDIREICRLGAEAAAITHGHPLGWLPGAVLAGMIHDISQEDMPIEDAVRHAMYVTGEMWPDTDGLAFLEGLMEKAIHLAGKDQRDLDAVHTLGEGWTGEEALAIAVYCALKYPDDLDRCLAAAVNHNGDSDSTGAIAGNIVGARIGLSGIPDKYTQQLELKDLILEVADDLWRGVPVGDGAAASGSVWEEKYVSVSYGRPAADPHL